MRKKFVLGLILSCSVALTACVGGPSQNETTETAGESTGKSEAEGTAGESGGESLSTDDIVLNYTVDILKKKYPDKEVLTWVYTDIVRITPEVNAAINDILVNNGSDYVVCFERLSGSKYELMVNNRIKEGNSPDIISAGVGESGTYQGTYRAYINNWFIDLEEYLTSDEGRKLWDSVPEECWMASAVNGQYQGVCSMLPFSTGTAYYVNKELMDKYNLTEADFENRGLAELYEILEAVEEEGCCIIHMEDRYIEGFHTVIENRNYQSDFIVVSEESDAAENLLDNEEACAWFRVMADYNKKGYFTEKDEVENKKDQFEDRKNFFISVGAVNDFDPSYEDSIKEELGSRFPEAGEIVVIPQEKNSLTTYFNSITGVCSSSIHKQQALDFLTQTMISREISDLLLYGIEGVDYELDAQGKVIPDMFSWVYSMYFGNTLISTPTIYEPDNKEQVFRGILSSMKKTAILGKYVDLTDYIEDIQKIQEITESYSGLWKGEYEDVDATLEEIRQKLNDANVQEVLEAVNAQLKQGEVYD